ncbi:reverse transcriptase domain-containing protein, partial [Trichonephila inaurata madagascariensis]
MEENSENPDTIYIGELKSVNELDVKETNCVWYEKILVNKNAVTFKLDTLSQVNVIRKSEQSLEACRELGLIQRLNMINKSPIETPELILKEFAVVFTGTGRLKRIVKIKLKENSVTHVAAPRKGPLSIHNKVKEELSNMVEAGIISKVEEPTEWLSQTSVNYLGHVLSDEGIKPDPNKIRAIEEFATPNCKEDLQRFLGN